MQAALVLHELRRKSPQARWAFLIHQGVVFFAGYRPVDCFAGDWPAEGRPTSAVLKLLQGIFDRHRDHSFFLLRSRIYLSDPPGPMEKGFIDLVAKRFSVVEGEAVGRLEGPLEWREVVPLEDEYYETQLPTSTGQLTQRSLRTEEEIVAALGELEAQIPRGDVLHDYSRPIGAILTRGEGEVVGHALHSGAINKTRHAEIDLIQGLFRAGFTPRKDERYTLYVSLKPCRMCAGTWAEVFTGFDLQVRYLRDDPGTKARGTELEARGLIRPLGPPAPESAEGDRR